MRPISFTLRSLLHSAVPTLFLITGLPGSGKTTLARQLEQQHCAVRFTPDEWMMPLFGAGESANRRWLLESELFWRLAARLLGLGTNVILDYGLWAREERDLFLERGEALGATVRLYALELPLAELWQRIDSRNQALTPDVPPISYTDLLSYWDIYQRPGTEELALYVSREPSGQKRTEE